MTDLWIVAFVALWVVVVLIGFVVVGTLRRVILLIEAAEASLGAAATASLGGLPIGSMIPAFAVETIAGPTFTGTHLHGEVTAVLFLSRSCEACEQLADDLARGHVPEDLGVRLIVVSDNASTAAELSISPEVTVLIDEDREVADAFDVRVVPRGFIVGASGLVLAAGKPNDWEELQRLLATAKGGDRPSDVTAAPMPL